MKERGGRIHKWHREQGVIGQIHRARCLRWAIFAAPALLIIALFACTKQPASPAQPTAKAVSRDGGGGSAAPDTLRWHWSPPISGLPAVSYQLQTRTPGGEWSWTRAVSDTAYTLVTGSHVQVRVCGVDRLGRAGEWSIPSEWSGK